MTDDGVQLPCMWVYGWINILCRVYIRPLCQDVHRIVTCTNIPGAINVRLCNRWSNKWSIINAAFWLANISAAATTTTILLLLLLLRLSKNDPTTTNYISKKYGPGGGKFDRPFYFTCVAFEQVLGRGREFDCWKSEKSNSRGNSDVWNWCIHKSW